jgi:hypothetical protein
MVVSCLYRLFPNIQQTYMVPPRSLIWKVTIASAIQIIAKTPLKTCERWSSRALIERKKDRSRQKSSGPLEICVSKLVP